MLIFFASEYVIRVWSAGCRAKFKGWIGRFHFMRTPISLIDLFVVLASSIVIGFHISGRIGSANPGIDIKNIDELFDPIPIFSFSHGSITSTSVKIRRSFFLISIFLSE